MTEKMSETMPEKMTETMTETIPERMRETMPETIPERMTETIPEKTEETTYAYTYTRINKDGTIGTYTKKSKYIPKKKTKEVTEEIREEIIYKWKLGVPKQRLRKEYDLSQRQIDAILGIKPAKLKKSQLDNEVIKILSSQPELTVLLNKILKVIYEHAAQQVNNEKMKIKNEIQSTNPEVNNENEIQPTNPEV